MVSIRIRKVSKRSLAGLQQPFEYDSDSHYKVTTQKTGDGWAINLNRRPFQKTFKKREVWPLVIFYKGSSEIYVAERGKKRCGVIQFEFEAWHKTVRIWDLYVSRDCHRTGVGSALMEKCKERARALGARRIILETQTSNSNAIDFYLDQGFDLVGMDLTNYTNEDAARNEVRLEMAYHIGNSKPAPSKNVENGKARTPKHRAKR